MTGESSDQALFIVRMAPEMATKARRTRARFTQELRRNIRAALARAGLRSRIAQDGGGMFVWADDARRARAQLERVFGIGTICTVEARSAPDLDTMAETARTHFTERVAGRRYAVRARRRGQHPFRSLDVERTVGAALNNSATVDLGNPEVTIHVEVQEGEAYLYSERVEGAGGLPLGTSGRTLALLSGGYDSAVAAWQMMRRGLAVDFLFCNLAGAAYERQVVQVAKVLTELWAFGSEPRLYVVDFTDIVGAIRAHTDARFNQVVLKRLMYRTAAEVARRADTTGVVTGESLGQVSSQTLSNLAAIEAGTGCLMLRPLIGQDKRAIMDQARRIGTGLLSERIPEFCALTDRPPAVSSTSAAIDAQADRLDPALVERAVAEMRSVALDTVEADSLRADYLFVEAIPEGARVIDCQPRQLYERWHVPGAVNRAPHELLDELRQLDKRDCYILYCPFGTQSAHLAEIMQQFGYQAYALKGGIGAVRRLVESTDAA